jgi:hypothetical protein
VVLTLSLSSCSFLAEKYAKNEAATAAFIANNKKAPARMNIEGVWYSPEWGMVLLNQEPGGKLTGVFQDYYQVRGQISGKTAYIALIDDDWTEYSVVLERKSWDQLSGYYSSDIPPSDTNRHEIVLKRIER